MLREPCLSAYFLMSFLIVTSPVYAQKFVVINQQVFEQESDDVIHQLAEDLVSGKSKAEIKDALYHSFVFKLASTGKTDALKAVFQIDPATKFKKPNGDTLLHVAAAQNRYQLIDLLLQQGMDIDATNSDDETALELAAYRNQIDMAKHLISKGANVEGNSQSNSPLITATQFNYQLMVELLIQNDADLTVRDQAGNSPLHVAVNFGSLNVVKVLLDHGADVDVVNDEGLTPIQIAKNFDVQALVDRGLNRNWGVEQLLGKPNASFSDDPKAWASKSQDGQAEWIIVEFEKPVIPKTIEVFESFNPGAVNRITMIDDAGKETEIWKGKDPAQRGPNGVYVAKIGVDSKGQKSKKFRINIDSQNVPGWNEIDAVALIDMNGGKQWAKAASASSCYATSDENFNRAEIVKLLNEYKR